MTNAISFHTQILFKVRESSAPGLCPTCYLGARCLSDTDIVHDGRRVFELHLQVCFAFKWVVSSFLSRSRMCGGGAGGAAGAWWALSSCSDCRVLWELLSGNTSSRQRTARPAMWVIHWYLQMKIRTLAKNIIDEMNAFLWEGFLLRFTYFESLVYACFPLAGKGVSTLTISSYVSQ